MSQGDNKIKITDNSAAVNTMPNSENKNNMNKSNSETALNTPANGANNLVNITNYQDNVRFDMVNKATEFLLASSQIKNSSMDRKIQFLRSKGLTDPEIELAIRTAIANGQNQNTRPPPQPVYYNTSNAVQMQLASHNWFRQLVGPITCVVLSIYFGFHVYKKYVEKWLFGKQKSPIEKRLEAIEVSIQRCVLLLEDKNITSEFRNQKNEFDKIHGELKSIKSLLLNRSQFPPAPVTSGIPQWQLLKNTKPQVDQHNRVVVNGVNMPNTSLLNMFNGQSNSPFSVVGSHTTGFIDGDIVDKNCTSINDSTPNGIMSPTSSDEKVVNVEVVALDNGQRDNSNPVICEDVNH